MYYSGSVWDILRSVGVGFEVIVWWFERSV